MCRHFVDWSWPVNGRRYPRTAQVSGGQGDNLKYLVSLGADNTEGVLFSSSYSPLSDTPDNAEFVKRYEKQVQELPPP